MGQTAHIANLASDDRCKIVALAELRSTLGREVGSRYNIENVYLSHRELLGDPRVEAVVVVTRPAATGPIVLDAARSGRHVFSEKPMAHTVEQAHLLVEAARAAGVVYAVGFMKRHDPGIALARKTVEEYITSKRFGELNFVRAYSLHGDIEMEPGAFAMTQEPRPDGLELWDRAPQWLPPPARESYSAFLNVHVHLINLLRFVFSDRPVIRYADLERPLARTVGFSIRNAYGVMELRDWATGPWSEGIELYFERADVRIVLPAPFAKTKNAEVWVRDLEGERRLTPASGGWAFEKQARAFVEDVLLRKTPLASGEDSLEDLEVIAGIWRCR